MKWRVVWDRRAANDIDAIAEFIAKDSKSAGKRVALHVRRACESLSSFPRRGRPTDRTNVRELVLMRYPYTVVYEVTDAEVRILGVVHQAQDRP